MTKKESLQLFEEKKVRTIWDYNEEKWYFSIVDVCGVLTDQPDTDRARNYWKVLKYRLVKEGDQTVTNLIGKSERTVKSIIKHNRLRRLCELSFT